MRICLACGGGKDVGLLVCWQCHNNLKLHFDGDYGPVMQRILTKAQEEANQHLPPEC